MKILQTAWEDWAQQQWQQRQQQEQNLQPASSAAQGIAPLTDAEVQQQLQIASWVSLGLYSSCTQLLVGSMPFVAWPQQRAREQGWAVLRWQPGDAGMWFIRILEVIEHRQSQAAAGPSGERPLQLLVKGELYESRDSRQQQQAMPARDADGLIIISTQPTKNAETHGLSVHTVPAEQLCPVRLCVVPHLRR